MVIILYRLYYVIWAYGVGRGRPFFVSEPAPCRGGGAWGWTARGAPQWRETEAHSSMAAIIWLVLIWGRKREGKRKKKSPRLHHAGVCLR